MWHAETALEEEAAAIAGTGGARLLDTELTAGVWLRSGHAKTTAAALAELYDAQTVDGKRAERLVVATREAHRKGRRRTARAQQGAAGSGPREHPAARRHDSGARRTGKAARALPTRETTRPPRAAGKSRGPELERTRRPRTRTASGIAAPGAEARHGETGATGAQGRCGWPRTESPTCLRCGRTRNMTGTPCWYSWRRSSARRKGSRRYRSAAGPGRSCCGH